MATAARTTSILVVDDDRTTRHLTRTTLAKAGYAVRVAQDGAEALTRMRGKKFDLVLLDVWMPRMDGLAVLDRMKRLKTRPRVIVMEGSSIVSIAQPDVLAYVVHPFLAPARWKEGWRDLMARADLVAVNRPRAETRPPAAEVMEAIASAAPRGAVVVADVTLPLGDWAPVLRARLHEGAAVRA